MIDGLKTEDYKGDDVSLTDDLYVADLISGGNVAIAGSFVGAGINVTTATSAGKLVSAVGTGSPSLTFGKWVQAGVGATGAGSNAWHVFPTAFAAAPTAILATAAETNEALMVPLGSFAAGSFYVETIGASKSFSYIAIQ